MLPLPGDRKTRAVEVLQHAADGVLEHALGRLLEQLLQADGLEVADVPGVVVVHLVLHLVAGDPDLLRIDHDDVVAGVHVRGEDRLVLALEAPRDLGGETTEGLALGIHDIPVAADFGGFGADRGVHVPAPTGPRGACQFGFDRIHERARILPGHTGVCKQKKGVAGGRHAQDNNQRRMEEY